MEKLEENKGADAKADDVAAQTATGDEAGVESDDESDGAGAEGSGLGGAPVDEHGLGNGGASVAEPLPEGGATTSDDSDPTGGADAGGDDGPAE